MAGSQAKRAARSRWGIAADESANGLDVARGDVYVATKATAGHPEATWWMCSARRKLGKPAKNPTGWRGSPRLHGTCEEPGEVVTGATPCEHSTYLPFTGPLRAVTVSPVNGDVLVADGGVVDVFETGALPGAYTFVRRISEVEGTPLESPLGLAVDGNGDIYDRQRGVVDQVQRNRGLRGAAKPHACRSVRDGNRRCRRRPGEPRCVRRQLRRLPDGRGVRRKQVDPGRHDDPRDRRARDACAVERDREARRRGFGGVRVRIRHEHRLRQRNPV